MIFNSNFEALIELNIVTYVYVFCILAVQAVYCELVIPRVHFSKTSFKNINQMLARWIVFTMRYRFSFKRDLLVVFQVSILLAAFSILPISGNTSVRIVRPDMAILLLMSFFYLVRISWGWMEGHANGFEKAMDELSFASTRLLIFALILGGAYLSGDMSKEHQLIGPDLYLLHGPFHLLAFVTAVLFIAFFQGSKSYESGLGALSRIAWRLEPIFWMTLTVQIFFSNKVESPAISFILLLLKTTFFLLGLDFIRAHIPRLRRDQIEAICLKVIYPLALVTFLGMWGQGMIL